MRWDCACFESKMGKYHKMDKIGEGTYGIVFKAKNCFTGSVVAMKKIRPDKETDSIPSTALREVSILRELCHPNIIKLYDVVKAGGNLYLVCEYLEFDLKRYLDFAPGESLSESLTKSYMKQVLEALHYCHSHKVLHRDLKTQNLLIDAKGNIKLADFGLSKATGIPSRTFTHEVVTLWYRSPDVLLGATSYTSAVDIWSSGCILAEMMSKKALFRGDSEIDQLFKIFMILGTPNENAWKGVEKLPEYNSRFPSWMPRDLKDVLKGITPDGLVLLKGLLEYDPMSRLSAKEALEQKYFDHTVKCLPVLMA